MIVTSASAGTLDAATSVAVNGPQDLVEEWNQIDWGRAEAEVRRLRQRIFTASKAGEHRKVRSLQRLMLRSQTNALVATRRVTQVNQGRRTAGVDGLTALHGSDRAELGRAAPSGFHRGAQQGDQPALLCGQHAQRGSGCTAGAGDLFPEP